ncbi:MAG: carbon-nitrogen hydrolase family protein [Planctomycetes bacterium]|nr:carbon-nitrogen hydrolase family protein [Planctomycetota bacterium]
MNKTDASSKFKVAAVQAAPHFLDVVRTVEKTCSLISEAAGNGAQLVAFPEVFVAAYPYWAWLNSPLDNIQLFKRLYKCSITVPGPQTQRLCEAAREHGVVVVIGVNEIDALLTGTIHNTNLIIDSDGTLMGKHRKLVPTYAEKLVWGNGDGSGLRVHQTACGRVGTLICGENTNTLARFALLALGEQIHVANFPAFPFTNWYEEAEAIRIRCQAHALEGKVFVIAATSLMDPAAIELLCDTPAKRERMSGRNFALSAVYGPDGRAIGEPLIDEEGIVYATVDLDDLITPKLMHDITGHYNQFGVLSLRLNRTPQQPLVERESLEGADGDAAQRIEPDRRPD